MFDILTTLAGSRAYNLHTEESDIDTLTVYVADLKYYFGLVDPMNYHRKQGDDDHTKYELRNFVRQCIKCNSQFLEALFSDRFILLTDHGKLLTSHRNIFLNKNIANTYVGFSVSEHNKIEKLSTNKGISRKEIIGEFNYDIKRAYNSIRLLFTLINFINSRNFSNHLKEDQRSEVMKIKKGFMPFEEYCKLYNYLKPEAEYLISKGLDWLPNNADRDSVDSLLIKIISGVRMADVGKIERSRNRAA